MRGRPRRETLQAKMCRKCGEKPKADGHAICMNCMMKGVSETLLIHEECEKRLTPRAREIRAAAKARAHEKEVQRYWTKKNAGLCTICGKKNDTKGCMCTKCKERFNRGDRRRGGADD